MVGFQKSGYAFDTATEIATYAQVMNSAIQTDAMPLGNATGMTTAERATFNEWFVAGASTSQ
jgi:uncharacterized membrane protein